MIEHILNASGNSNGLLFSIKNPAKVEEILVSDLGILVSDLGGCYMEIQSIFAHRSALQVYIAISRGLKYTNCRRSRYAASCTCWCAEVESLITSLLAYISRPIR